MRVCKVLIIGGAGYIGSHQVKWMLDRNYDVVVLDNLSTGYEDSVDKAAKLYIGDVRDLELVKEILTTEKIEVIIHFAALSLVGESVTKPLDYYDNNVYGMQVLLQAMHACNVDKIIFSSTAAVYGMHEVMPITEEYAKEPINPYGETKLAMEKMVKWAKEAYGINYVVLRYFNVAGASLDGVLGERHQPETHLIPLVLQVPRGMREFISIFGDDYNTPDKTCIRDYIHVLDLASAHEMSVQYLLNNTESKTYNLGYNMGYSVKEIIEVARKVTGHAIPVKIETRRAGDPDSLVASNDKIVKELNWKPMYQDIETIVETAYQFYQKMDEKNNGH